MQHIRVYSGTPLFQTSEMLTPRFKVWIAFQLTPYIITPEIPLFHKVEGFLVILVSGLYKILQMLACLSHKNAHIR